MTVRGEPVKLDITVSGLAITEHVIWMGVDVDVAFGKEETSTDGRSQS